MSWMLETLVRERQRELLAEADRRRLVAEARRGRGGSHLLRAGRHAVAQLRAVARLRRRLA